jgi:hypothetical protein
VQIDQQYYAALKGCTGESAGTTALAVLVWGTTLYVANAGEPLLQQPAHMAASLICCKHTACCGSLNNSTPASPATLLAP